MSRHERSQADAVSRTATRIEAALGQLRAIDDMRSALFGWGLLQPRRRPRTARTARLMTVHWAGSPDPNIAGNTADRLSSKA